jgi:hypothetical protein
MAIKIEISNTVGFKVRGSINNEAGTPVPFDFSLTCTRLDADQISARLNSANDETMADFMVSVIENWSGVRDGDDQLLPYSPEAYRRLCKIPGVANIALRTYLAEAGAKEKN